MTGIDDLDGLLAETSDAPPSDVLDRVLDRIVAALPDGPGRHDRIGELVDESRAAWQWLLGGRRRGRILLLSGGWSASALALARVWEHVTVLDPSSAACGFLERRAAEAGFGNLEAVADACTDRLPCGDTTFDALCWSATPSGRVPCAPAASPHELAPLLREAARVLAPGGELYLGLPNRWRRSRLLQKSPDPLYTLDNVVRAVRAAGLRLHSLHAHENDDAQERFFVDLSDRVAIRAFQDQHPGRGRHLPLWFYRRMTPQYAVVAGPQPAGTPWLTGALRHVRRLLDADGHGWTASPPAVNRKGKLVSILSRAKRAAWVVKIPLRPEIREDMERAGRVLDDLSARLPGDDLLAGLLPRDLRRIDYEGMPLYVESACAGRPWAAYRKRPPRVRDTDLPEVLARLLELDAAPSTPPGVPAEKAALLSDLLARHAPGLTGVLDTVATRLDDAGSGRPAMLRKGDLTLSNVFLDGARVSGLIDWDETESSRLPLSAYADLVFSWLWQFGGVRRADGLALCAGGALDDMPRALDVRETLARLGGDAEAFATAALASWLDHAYHELKHPVFGHQPDRLRGLLIEPCRALARLWGQPVASA